MRMSGSGPISSDAVARPPKSPPGGMVASSHAPAKSNKAAAIALSILTYVLIFGFMLTYETKGAALSDATAPLIVLMHGRGSNRFDLMSLNDHMPTNATVVFP